MTTTIRWGIAALIIAGVAAGVTLAVRPSLARPTAPAPQLAAPTPVVKSPAPTSAPPRPAWQQFPDMSRSDQEDYATRMMNQQGWSAEMRQGLLAQLGNRALSPLTRNNLAIGILRNGTGTTDFEQALWTAYDDAAENPVWREYTIQFMAVCLEEGSTAAGSRTRLLDAFHGGGAMAATAAIQLNRLADKAVLPIPEDFATIVVERAGDRTLAPAQRSTLLGIIGMRYLPAGLVVARGYLADEDVTMRRTAFACLGDLGGSEDLPAIALGLNDPHPLVQMAAATAKEKVDKRLLYKDIPRPSKE